MELARKAVWLVPKSGVFWNTLGVALYRAGDGRQAIAALTRSMELRKGGDSFDWFFLAMAHRRIDEPDEARRWYDRAVQWMKKNQAQNEELRRFRAEAAGVLGLERRTDREGRHAPSDDAIHADPFLQTDSSGARARGNQSVGQSADAAMPNGPAGLCPALTVRTANTCGYEPPPQSSDPPRRECATYLSQDPQSFAWRPEEFGIAGYQSVSDHD